MLTVKKSAAYHEECRRMGREQHVDRITPTSGQLISFTAGTNSLQRHVIWRHFQVAKSKDYKILDAAIYSFLGL